MVSKPDCLHSSSAGNATSGLHWEVFSPVYVDKAGAQRWIGGLFDWQTGGKTAAGVVTEKVGLRLRAD